MSRTFGVEVRLYIVFPLLFVFGFFQRLAIDREMMILKRKGHRLRIDKKLDES